MTTRSAGRHRAPARTASLALAPSSGPSGAVAKTGAVIAVSGGLVASLGLQAQAATPMTTGAASSTSEAASAAQQASGLPAGLQTGVAKAPSFGEIGFTAKAAAVKRKPVVRIQRVIHKVSRSAPRAAVAPAPAPVYIKAGAPGSPEFGAAVLAIAARYAGTPYVYGGTTPAGFDCSGYTLYVYRQVGITLPRTSSAQSAAGTRVSRSDAMPGDLVFMPGHIGIYAGNGMMWDSPRTGKSVGKHAIYSSSAVFVRVG